MRASRLLPILLNLRRYPEWGDTMLGIALGSLAWALAAIFAYQVLTGKKVPGKIDVTPQTFMRGTGDMPLAS